MAKRRRPNPVNKPYVPKIIWAGKKYNNFHRSTDNRKVKITKGDKLMASMRKYGYLPYFPINVRPISEKRGHFEIREGQHRFDVSEILEIDFCYTIEVPEHRFEIPDVNNAMIVWKFFHYVEHFIDSGYRDYEVAYHFHRKYNISLNLSMCLLMGYHYKCGKVSSLVKDGLFEVTAFQYAERVAVLYQEMVRISRDLKCDNFVCTCAGMLLWDDFNAERLISNADRCRDLLKAYNKIDTYLTVMEAVYNHHYPLKSQKSLAFEVRKARAERELVEIEDSDTIEEAA